MLGSRFLHLMKTYDRILITVRSNERETRTLKPKKNKSAVKLPNESSHKNENSPLIVTCPESETTLLTVFLLFSQPI